MEINLGKWRRMNVLYESDGMNVFTRIYQINKKRCIMPPNLKYKIIYFLFRCFPTSLSPSFRGVLSERPHPASSLAGARLIPKILLAPGEEDGAGAPSQGGAAGTRVHAGGSSERG
jgi:hypothetical protein